MAGVDTGTAYASIRIRLDQLDQDAKGVYARLDKLESYINASTVKATKSATSAYNAMDIAGVAAFIGIGAAAKSAISTFANFDQSMANVASVTNASTLEFAQLKQAASDAGETTRYTASQAADALYYLAQSGMTATQSTQALNGVLALAQASGSDLASTADSMAATLSQFGLAASEAGRVSNVFAAANADSLASMDKLTASLRQVGPVAGTLGISLEEVVANLDALYNKGFQGEQAGTALRSILLDLVDPSSEVVKQLKAQGIQYDKVNPRVVGLTGAFKAMAEAGVDLTTVFGKVSASEALALVDTAKSSTKNLDDLQKAITGTNAAADQEARRLDSLSGSWDIMTSNAEAAGNVLVDNVKPALRALIETVGNLFVGISKLPSIIQTIIASGTAATVMIGGITAALKLFGVTLASGPIGIVIASLTALSTVAVLVTNKLNEQNNVTKQLDETTLALQKTSKDYNDVTNQLDDNTKNLTDSERKLLENRKALLKLDLEKQLNSLAGSYTKTKKVLDDLVTSTQEHNTASQSYLSLARDTQKEIDKINAQDKITWMNKIRLGELEDTLNTYRKLAVKENEKYLTSQSKLIKGNSDQENSLNALAQGVANGILNIDNLKTINIDLYNAIMAAVPAQQNMANAIDDTGNSAASSTPKILAWQQALKDALNLTKTPLTGQSAVAEYTANISTELSKALDAARTTGGDVAKVYEDYASNVRAAVTDLIMSGQYVGSEDTIQRLREYADNLQLMTWFYSEDAGAIDQLAQSTVNWSDVQKTAITEAVASFETLGQAMASGEDVWSAWGSAGLNAIAAVIEGIANQLVTQAALLIAADFWNPAAWVANAAVLTEAAAAYTAAGVVKGLAANMATGGIVAPSAGGTLVRVAENGSEEGIFNAGSSGQPLIDAFTAAMVKNMGASGSQTIVLSLDGKEVTRVVTRRQKNGDY